MCASRLPGKTGPKAKDSALVRRARFSVTRRRHTELAQAWTAESHHGRIAHGEFDDRIQSSIRRIAVQTSPAMNGAPVEAFAIDRAAIGNAGLFVDLGQQAPLAQCAALQIEGISIDPAFPGMRDIEFVGRRVPGKAIVQKRFSAMALETSAERKRIKLLLLRRAVDLRIEHRAEPQSPGSIAIALVETVLVRIERRLAQRSDRARREIERKDADP